jgi:hypothetical protein
MDFLAWKRLNHESKIVSLVNMNELKFIEKHLI